MGVRRRIIRGLLISLTALTVPAGCRNMGAGEGGDGPDTGDPLFGEFRSPPARQDRAEGFGLGRPVAEDREPPPREEPPATAKAYPPTGNPLLRGSEVTNAAMAAGLRERRGRESDLRLEWPDGARRPARKPEENSPPAGVLLQPPRDANRGFVRDDPDADVREVAGPSLDDADMMIEELKQLGALETRLEPTEGGWHFSCVVPSKRNQLVQRRYAFRDPVKAKAVEAVLEQVRRESRR